MKKKKKKVKLDPEKMKAMFKEAGFTDEQIKAHYINKEKEEKVKKALKKELEKNKPKARIFLGLNTNSM
jgi:hypothetical protein